jgi:Icc-related predicted phosphoesterase
MQTIKFKNQHLLLLSDTHGKHRNLAIPENIDILIHCGDICDDGNMEQIADFFSWLEELKIKNKIFVNGNHDLPFELEPLESKKLIPENVLWLNDETIVINKIKIKAISPFFYLQNTDYDTDIDILLSHYPPLGILDHGIGTKEIKDYTFKTKPTFHIFGHNHLGAGSMKIESIMFVNASNFEELQD